ncbi:hypothetical protein H8S75_31950 [Hungatella sp. L12]|uniref:Tail fiber protein n=1 Tax=Hungatella hominis TaxID=2763050 RepID=A0ABR7HH93_9FIRM|nr:hypothetical protein [Hungatella hominis]MBC5712517.1 hypothetical protein [Hungatella hominis]
MATNTANYNFKKPDESDFYSVQDQNNNWDKADTALKNLDTPTFEDYSGSTTVPDAATAINNIKSKGKLSTILSNMKAAFKGVCLIGQIVNNCVTNNSKLPLSAAQGKELMDLYTVLNSNLDNITSANTLLYTFKYLPPSFLDNPNNHFKVSGWTAVPYLSLSNIANGAGWGVILGIYDNNNGTPLGRQFVIGTSKVATRRYVGGSWTVWE